jgi:Helicase conserved C-terminal domain
MPARHQVLLRCPFCDAPLQMAFDRRSWRLEHRCTNEACPWPENALPFYIVDEEIYRFLPTIVVGTLDKVASISMQAAMRGFVAPPHGRCSERDHGFVYAARSERPNGCLVPGCRGQRLALPAPTEKFPPTFRLQDELHLLRDSLGAIDSHYESLLDHLQGVTCGVQAKIVASSATLTGYQRQCDVLYRRDGRVFPVPGPSAGDSFWSAPTPNLLRRFVSLAPRGATLEYAADRILTVLQQSIRELNEHQQTICAELGIDPKIAGELVSLYGTNVVYGNTIRDLDASVRSLETQVPVTPLHTSQLTGQTQFDEVRSVLERLQTPEIEFDERIHVVAASSMMSHGVDIDRLNSMVMLGVPLTTAEFIQATSRIGRSWPGLVFVLHKMALERDASVFRSFRAFVEQGDRFVEAIPVTRRSRRVLERTLPGIVMARLRHIHEPRSTVALTLIERVRHFFTANGIGPDTELDAIAALLQLDRTTDAGLLEEAERLLTAFFRNLNDPATSERFPDRLFSSVVMRSLRDVEEQAPIHD